MTAATPLFSLQPGAAINPGIILNFGKTILTNSSPEYFPVEALTPPIISFAVTREGLAFVSFLILILAAVVEIYAFPLSS